jgi:beta-lactamase superfamily II metal-dependent hydrolase
MTTFHFLNVGQGNMAVGIFPDGKILAYDCNITNENEEEIFTYLQKIMPKNSIDVFVNSHRDADHMRGIKKLHERYPVTSLFDSGVSGNTETTEYEEYMDFRRNITDTYEVEPNQWWTAHPGVKIINGKRDGLEDTNSQSIVLHIDYNGSQLLLAGDSDVVAWRDYIVSEVGDKVKSLVLYASHHGSHAFFNEDPEKNDDFTTHLEYINPAIAIISVGATNPHGHPKEEAISHYENYCYGAENGQKIFRTDQHGNMKIELHGGGTGTIYWGLK